MIERLEKSKKPVGEVTLIGLGRLGFRVALNLMQVHQGGPEKIKAIDGQRISPDDMIFRLMGANIGEYKVKFLEKLAGEDFKIKIEGVPTYISKDNLEILGGDVISITIAGGNTLPITTAIINHAKKIGALTISTMGVFGVGGEKIIAEDISKLDKRNPIVKYLRREGIKDHILVGTGKLIRDWEPITPYVLDDIAKSITSEILKLLHKKLGGEDH